MSVAMSSGVASAIRSRRRRPGKRPGAPSPSRGSPPRRAVAPGRRRCRGSSPVVPVADPARLDVDDAGEVRAAVEHLQRLVDLLLVLGDEHLRARVRQQVADLGGRVRRVEPDRDAPGPRPCRRRSRATRGGSPSGWRPGHPARSPGPAARARRSAPVSQYAAQVTSCQMPRSFSRIATRCGVAPRAVAYPGRDRGGRGARGGRGSRARRCLRFGHARCTSPRYARITSGLCWISAGVPVATGWPKSTTSTRSARSMTRPMSCSTRMIGMSSSSRMSRM